jgi:signal transduction histidine kinase/ActR/RegA family two-component response regulator
MIGGGKMPDTVGIPIEEGFFCLDGNWRFTFVNRITLGVLGKSQEDIQGKVIWEVLPTLVGSTFEQTCHSVLEQRSASRVEIRSTNSGIFYHLVVFPSPGTGGVAVYWRDVTADKQARETLETLVEKLKLADEGRIAFMNTLSHELRNPLAAISMGLMLLKEAPAGSEQAEKAQSIMARQTTQLSRLVDDLLDVTRIAQKKIELKKEWIDLNEVVYHTIMDFQPQYVEKGVTLDFELNPEIIPMIADRARLTQAIGNLLHNSVKFTGKGGRTRVTVKIDEEVGKQALIIVRDNGLGIDPALLPEIFEPFVQADNSLAHNGGGLGLGLPIVKGITILHGGWFRMESEGIGKGTRAVICLPLPENLAAYTAEVELTEDEKPSRPLKVLIVEDIADLAEIMSELMTHLGHNVTIALNGQEGLSLARHHRPDVLISDIGLPGMSGYELAEEFQNDEQLKGVYLIALSGYAQPEDYERSNKAGFRSHLAKPVNLENLKAALREAEICKEER